MQAMSHLEISQITEEILGSSCMGKCPDLKFVS